MASSTTSLQFLSLPSSKTLTILSQTLFPTSRHGFPSSQNPSLTPFSIPTSSKLFEVTPSSRIVTKVSLSPDLELDDDLPSGVDEELEQGFSPELKVFVGNLLFHVDNADLELDDEPSTGVDEELEQGFSPEHKLFVGNLPFHVDDAALAGLFEQSGNVEMVEVVYDKLNGRSRGFAFVKMSSVKEAEAAAKKFDGYKLDGRQLRVNYGPPPRKKSFIKEPRDDEIREDYTNNTVYVGNLSWNVGNETLENLFWEHGNVIEAKVFYDKDSGRSRGFGFVTYSCANEVYNAVKSLDGVDLDGRNIRVSVAVPAQRRYI